MDKKKIEFLIIGVLIFLFLIFSIRAILRVTHSKPSVNEKILSEKVSEEQKKESYNYPTLKAKLNLEVKNLTWRRDPFFRNKYVSDVFEEEVSEIENLYLTGIIWDEENPVAVISDEIVKENQTIGKLKVKRIYKDSVILFNGDKEIKLHLNRASQKCRP